MKNKINYLLYYLSEFLLSVILIILVILFICSKTIFSPNYIIKELDKNDYYEYLEKEIKDEMSNYIVQSGLGKEVLDNIYSLDDIKNTTNSYVKAFYNNKELKVDSSKVKDRLEANIDKYLEEENIVATDREAMDKFVSQMSDIYEEAFSISSIIDKTSPYIVKVEEYVNIAIVAVCVIFIVLVLLAKLYFKKNILTTVMMTTSFIILFIMYYLTYKIDFSNLVLLSNSKIINNVALSIISCFKNTSFIMIVLSIAIYIINDRISSKGLGDNNGKRRVKERKEIIKKKSKKTV